MKLNDAQLGKPQVLYKDTLANIAALSGVAEGSLAYATDTNLVGSYDGSAWAWYATANVDLDTKRLVWIGW